MLTYIHNCYTIEITNVLLRGMNARKVSRGELHVLIDQKRVVTTLTTSSKTGYFQLLLSH